MAANFLHGVETIEIDSGPRAVTLVKTAVIGIIGTAAAGAVNTPILVTSERDFAQFGEDIPNSTIRKALNRVYKQRARSPSSSTCSTRPRTRPRSPRRRS